jgi:hypothetical protein
LEELEAIFAQPLSLSRRVLAHGFGIKISVATTAHRSKGGQFVTHIAALLHNP